MPYCCDLGSGQSLYLDNQGNLTVITVASGGVGQQQQSSSSIQTGPWLEPPQVARLANGAIIRCVSSQGTVMVQVQGGQIGLATGTTRWDPEKTVTLQSAHAMPGPAMQPMQPMQPMTMGDMQMSTNPMAMRMGNMEMQMGAPQGQPPGRFCTQCGAAVQSGDRFCGSCGHPLTP